MRAGWLLSLLLIASCESPRELLAPAPDLSRDASADLGSPRGTDGSSDGELAEAMAPAEASAPGVGVTIEPDGVGFRVWAPHASSVGVVGAFTQGQVSPLERENGGMFSSKHRGARVGDAYHFEIEPANGATPWLSRLDPAGRAISGTESLIVDSSAFAWHSNAWTPPPRESWVVYEMHVGSFVSASDPGRGTFSTALTKLDHLQALGVTVLELMPVHDWGGVGWGYSPKNYFAPNRPYGSPDEFRKFVDEAHSRGMAVILDVVYNHYSSSRTAPLYCFDGDCSGNSGIYFFSDPLYAKTPWGPRPNFDEPEVAKFLLGASSVWLDEYRADGFRVDSVSNIRAVDGQGKVPGGRELLTQLNQLVHAKGKIAIAEDLKGDETVTQPASEGGLSFDSQWRPLGELVDLLSAKEDVGRDLGTLNDALYGGDRGDPFARVLYLESHDTVGNAGLRTPNRIDPTDPASVTARKRSALGAAVLLTLPGVPMLFQGQEMLAQGTFASDPKPLNWEDAVAHAGILALYTDLIRLRRNLDSTSVGLLGKKVAVTHRNDGAKVMAYFRGEAGSETVVVANFGGTAFPEYDVGVPSRGAWNVRIDTDWKKYSSDFGGGGKASVVSVSKPQDGQSERVTLVLGPYSVVILSK